MNIYGCLPSAFFSSPSAVSYWAHTASLAGYHSAAAESALGLAAASHGLALNAVKKSQLQSQMSRELSDVVLNKRVLGGLDLGVALIRDPTSVSSNSVPTTNATTAILNAPFRIACAPARRSSPSAPATSSNSNADDSNSSVIAGAESKYSPQHSGSSAHNIHNVHNQGSNSKNLHCHIQDSIQLAYNREYVQTEERSSPIPVNGLMSLQALCDSDVSVFTAKGSNRDSSLKFGISRILSDDFGKNKDKGSVKHGGVVIFVVCVVIGDF